MTRKPAVGIVAVAGRRQASLEVAKRLEQEGFDGIYCPSLTDNLAFCTALAFATNEIKFGTSITYVSSLSARFCPDSGLYPRSVKRPFPLWGGREPWSHACADGDQSRQAAGRNAPVCLGFTGCSATDFRRIATDCTCCPAKKNDSACSRNF